MNGEHIYLSTVVYTSEVASNNNSIKGQWIKLCKSYTTWDLLIDAEEVATKEKLEKWKYLGSISKKVCQDKNNKIGILIEVYC